MKTQWQRCVMTREEIYKEMEGMFGLVPSFFKMVPDSTLELEWRLMKRVQFDEGPIPNKYRELIGLALSAVTKCRYCTVYHTEMARLYGATEEEIEDAVHYAKSSAGWSTYLNGMQVDYDEFKKEVLEACEYVRREKAA
jgi:AhpD family alkylhydroperoxidase